MSETKTIEYLAEKIEEDVLKDYLLDSLRKAECNVLFTKANGDDRLMRCSLRSDFIPEDQVPQGGTTTTISEETIRVFDTEVEAWRSFRIDSVIHIQTIEEVCVEKDGS